MRSDRSTLYLNRTTIESLGLGMSRIIDLVESSLVEKAHGRTQMPAKHWMEPRPTRWFGGMSCLIPAAGYASMKWQSGSSENAARDLPYLTGMLFLNRLDDGLVAAVMDSTWITQQRTAAGSAVAVRHLATPGATGFAMLGCGVQARSHLEAFAQVMPALQEVVAYDIDRRAAAGLLNRSVDSGVARRESTTTSNPTNGVPLPSVSGRPSRITRQGTTDDPWVNVPAGTAVPLRRKASTS